MSESSDFVHLQRGLIAPLAAVRALLAVETAGVTPDSLSGNRLRVDGGDIVIEPGRGLTPELLAELKRWKRHAILLLEYRADDSHLRDAPFNSTPCAWPAAHEAAMARGTEERRKLQVAVG